VVVHRLVNRSEPKSNTAILTLIFTDALPLFFLNLSCLHP
jgi:hypothetical protein